LQFDLDDYESEVPNHDHAEVQEEEEVWEHKKLPQASDPQIPAPDTRASNTITTYVSNRLTQYDCQFFQSVQSFATDLHKALPYHNKWELNAAPTGLWWTAPHLPQWHPLQFSSYHMVWYAMLQATQHTNQQAHQSWRSCQLEESALFSCTIQEKAALFLAFFFNTLQCFGWKCTQSSYVPVLGICEEEPTESDRYLLLWWGLRLFGPSKWSRQQLIADPVVSASTYF
jgi:hypothetical protein